MTRRLNSKKGLYSSYRRKVRALRARFRRAPARTAFQHRCRAAMSVVWVNAIAVLCAFGACASFPQSPVPAPSAPQPGDAYFNNWPKDADPVRVGKRVAERFIPAAHMDMSYLDPPGGLHYAQVATWYGALTYAALAKDKDLTQQLVARFQPFFGAEARRVPMINHVDASVFGALPLEIYRQTSAHQYRAMGLTFADGQWDRPREDGLTNQTRFWIDDMYMITLLQVQAFRSTGDVKYLDRTAAEMVAYLDKLQQPNGLFFHAPDAPIHWGRGNGWMAAGMTELLSELPAKNRHRPRILAAYRKMMATLLAHQAASGMWRQVVDHPEFWEETSGSAMFTFAFVTGVKSGWLDEKPYALAARKAWIALTSYITAEGDVREVCVGTGTKNDLNHYLTRPRAVGDPHGQAPVLWTASALLR
jgi:unsaturated rhamnogalacturonyl hydrolase